MSEREKLIELMTKAENAELSLLEFEKKILADYLLANGVIVPPVKVGGMVWVIYNKCVMPANVLAIYVDKSGGMFDLKILIGGVKSVVNKDYTFDMVYLTKEQAEKALKGGVTNE